MKTITFLTIAFFAVATATLESVNWNDYIIVWVTVNCFHSNRPPPPPALPSLSEEGVLAGYASIQSIEMAIQTIHILQEQIKNELLNASMPAVEAMLRSVIDQQKKHINDIKFNKSELQKLASQLVKDNEKSKTELAHLKAYLEQYPADKHGSAEFLQFRSMVMAKIEIELSWIEQKLTDITDVLKHNKSHAKNSQSILDQLVASDASIESLKALMEEHKVHDPKKPKKEAEKAIETAVEKLGRINTILSGIQWN